MTWTYDRRSPKPHVHPVVAPNGRVLSRSETPDHPWQRGLWFAIKFVNGENFWEEIDAHGSQRHADDRTVEWIRPDGTVAVDERRTVTVVDDETLDWTTTLVPRDDVVLDRTPFQGWGGYGGLSFRGSGDWTGTRLATETLEGTELLGVRSRWCDLSSADAGLAVLDHPDNPRHPVPWYGNVANPLYGTDEPTNFVNAAFLWDEPMTVPAGSTLSLRYRLIVHDGRWHPTQCDDAWRAWTEPEAR